MAFYDGLFNIFGLKGWCGEAASSAPMSMAELLAKSSGKDEGRVFSIPFTGQSERELPRHHSVARCDEGHRKRLLGGKTWLDGCT